MKVKNTTDYDYIKRELENRLKQSSYLTKESREFILSYINILIGHTKIYKYRLQLIYKNTKGVPDFKNKNIDVFGREVKNV